MIIIKAHILRQLWPACQWLIIRHGLCLYRQFSPDKFTVGQVDQFRHFANQVILIFADITVGKGDLPERGDQLELLLGAVMVIYEPGKLVQGCGLFLV